MGKTKNSEMGQAQRKKLCGEMHAERTLLRTRVRQVAQQYTTALFVHGPGGHGKTHEIVDELNDLLGNEWRHHTAYTTPPGLMDIIERDRDRIHLFEDCEKMYKQDLTASILRAACGSPRDAIRMVSYETAIRTRCVKFTGGIIIVSNESLTKSRGSILQAVASRFRPVSYSFSQQHIIAGILTMAAEGWERQGRKLTPAQCKEVANYLVDSDLATMGIPLEFRVFHEHALPAYCQWLDDPSGPPWQDVLASTLRGDTTSIEDRGARDERLLQLAWQIQLDNSLQTFGLKIEEWKRRSGLGKSQYYERVKAAKGRAMAAQRATLGTAGPSGD